MSHCIFIDQTSKPLFAFQTSVKNVISSEAKSRNLGETVASIASPVMMLTHRPISHLDKMRRGSK
jgi:hypothetical protein